MQETERGPNPEELRQAEANTPPEGTEELFVHQEMPSDAEKQARAEHDAQLAAVTAEHAKALAEAQGQADGTTSVGVPNKVYLGTGYPNARLAGAVGLGGAAMFGEWAAKKLYHGTDRLLSWFDKKADEWIKKGEANTNLSFLGITVNPAKWVGTLFNLGKKPLKFALDKMGVDLSKTTGELAADAAKKAGAPVKGGKRK